MNKFKNRFKEDFNDKQYNLDLINNNIINIYNKNLLFNESENEDYYLNEYELTNEDYNNILFNNNLSSKILLKYSNNNINFFDFSDLDLTLLDIIIYFPDLLKKIEFESILNSKKFFKNCYKCNKKFNNYETINILYVYPLCLKCSDILNLNNN